MDTGQNEPVPGADAYKTESLPVQSPPKVGYRKTREKYPAERFSSMIRRLNPIAAINGTYFDTITKRPVGTIVINGQLVHVGDRGTAMCLDSNNRVEFLLTSGIPGTAMDWTRYRTVISTGPTLVRNDRIYLYPRAEKFKDPAVYARARRSAVGVTMENKLLLVTVKRKITLRQLARIMKALGARDAVALDGGTSSGLYYRGKMVTKPGRTLTNILSVYETPSPALSPGPNRVPD
ncbi:MAG: phosphodiester glycosidase family protein [Armatimonadetes bacterium]|nr:phosphodiester glycosidase family protein [Armatimonadota bacterium]